MKKIFTFLCLILLSNQITSQQLNVYLKYQSPELNQQIKLFNQFLTEHGVFKKYNIEPFIEKYPLHTTLYLTDYPPINISVMTEAIARASQNLPKLETKTGGFFVTTGNYVMLDVDLSKQSDGNNAVMQQLSDKLVLALSSQRDFDAKIPDWAQSIPSKRKAFERYGSPNVFFEFSPHFTLMAKNFSNPDTVTQFQNELRQLIEDYAARYGKTKVSIISHEIGIGTVNEFGQVTKELASIDF